MLLDPYYNAAQDVALKAGEYLKDHFNSPHNTSFKSHIHDIVTECDRYSEELIKKELKSKFPESNFLCEESGEDNHQSRITWVVDPLDGTVNFAKKIPFFCVSIALLIDNLPACGVVYSPMTGELFSAKKHGGAFLNGNPIHVSLEADLKKAMCATGFPYLVQYNLKQSLIPLEKILQLGLPIRRLGSAALDLSYTACGRFDVFFEAHLEAWDYAAAGLILQEAGGSITDFKNNPLSYKKSSSIVGSNTLLHAAMVEGILL